MITSQSTNSFSSTLNYSFYPIPFESYFLIVVDRNGYKFWNEVINLIKQPLKDQEIEVVVSCDDNNNYDCYTVRNLSLPHVIYLCKNSVGHIGCDNNSKDFSDKNFDFSILPEYKFSDIKSKFDGKNPAHLASLICGKKFNNIVYIGCNYNQKFIEFVPTSKIETSTPIVLRLDKGGNISNAIGHKYNGIIFNSCNQFDEKIFSSSSKIYAIIDDIKLNDIKDHIDNRWAMICSNQEILSAKRCEYIDYKVFLSDNSKRGLLKDKDLSDCFCSSNRKIYKDGIFYNSYAHMKKGLTFSEKFDIIDCNDFWESQDFLRILKK